MGDFNAEVEDSSFKYFCSSYYLTGMINRPACFINLEKPSCIDLILTNCPRSFQNSHAIETGLWDFHKLVVTVMDKGEISQLSLKRRYQRQLCKHLN